MKRTLVGLLLLVTFSIFAADQSDPRLEKWLEQSRKVFQAHHLIAYVRLAHIDKKGPPFEFRYDRYPEGIERVQKPDGAALAHKKGKKWMVSDDWGETGEEVDPSVAKQTEAMIGYVDIPLSGKHESKDKSQGADVVRVVNQRKTDEGNEEIVFERGREHQKPDGNYPRLTFFRYKDAPPDDVILTNYSGPVYDVGGGKVQLDVRYEYMVAVKMDESNVKIITPPPSPSPE
ncbi:MAG TPA: hypothetical protein VJ281_06280 [Chthoniobacterales bacterium]|nr:hypothetical protein [Chthoniobacterales bacterium]